MSPFWWGFICGAASLMVWCIVIGIAIPLIMFCTGKGAIH